MGKVRTTINQFMTEQTDQEKSLVITKNPSDFIGAVLGASEQNTKAILANAMGKVLIIDEVGQISIFVFLLDILMVVRLVGIYALRWGPIGLRVQLQPIQNYCH